MALLSVIRRWHLRDGHSIREIARLTGVSRNTVTKHLAANTIEPKFATPERPSKIDPFAEKLAGWLKTEAGKSRKQRRTMKQLHADLVALGFTGSYARVAAFARRWRADRQREQQTTGRGTFVPLVFQPGEAFQFDWSDEGIVVGGVYHQAQVAHLKLCASRAFWLVAYPSQGHEMLFDAHTRSFAALGGVARRGIYDNMKTAVDKVKKGKGRVVNARFAAMCSHYLFDADFCNVASGWEKGVVEKNVQDSRRRVWLQARERKFTSFAELNAWLAERCKAVWADTPHPQHRELSIAEVLQLEREHLMGMPAPFDGYVERPARVSSTCLVTVARNRYSVPCEWAGHMVSTRLYPGRVDVVAGDALVASHERVLNRGQTVFDWQHYIELVQRKPGALRNGAPFADMPRPLAQLRHALMRHTGGDRVLSEVLALVPTAGLDTLLVAVELVLEHATPSGHISVEHVRNVLARLSDPQRPPPADTALALREAPRADTHRYDRLRAADAQEAGHAN